VDKRRNSYWIPFLLLGFAGRVVSAAVPGMQISAETAPAGGWAQIKIYAVKPMAIAAGHLVLSLDSTAFGAGTTVGLFGANGDAQGLAAVTGSQMDVQFSSASGGIGQLAGLPVLVFSVPVLASAAGRTVAVTASSPDSSVTVAAGSVTVTGTLSVAKIPAGLGVAAAGTVVPVTGTGFTASTTVTMDGVAIASTQFVSAQEVDITLGGAAELVGKRARVSDGATEFDYFCFQPGDPVNVPAASGFGAQLANVQPLFPLFASTGLRAGPLEIGGVIAIQNPNASAATVTDNAMQVCCGPLQGTSSSFSIPPGSWIEHDSIRVIDNLSSNLPVRVVPIALCAGPLPPGCLSPLSPAFPSDPGTEGQPAPAVTPASLVFAWQKGSAAPAPRTILASASETIITATPATTSGGTWLSVSSETATAAGYTFSVSVDPSQLAVGTYPGSLLLQQSFGPPATVPVTLTVTAAAVPMISASPASLTFTATTFTATPYSQTVALTSDSGPAAFSVNLQPGSWLKVSPMSGTTPGTLTVTWDPAVTSQIYYPQRSTPGSLLISGPGNQIGIPATFNVTGVQTFQTYLGASGGGPNGLVFSSQAGSAPQSQTINVDPAGAITATADQPWMAVSAPTTATVAVTVNPTGLAAGAYHGTVTIAEPGIPSMTVPVLLGIWSTAPPLTIATGNFTFVQTLGEPAPPYQTAEVDSGGVPVPLTIAVDGNWLNVVDHYSAPTPTQLLVGIGSPPGTPGEYDGSFTVQSPGGSVYAPVTLLVEPGPMAPPVVSQVVNAASGIQGAISPGEIVSIRGYGVGASAVGGLRLDPSGGLVSQINGLQVTFDGKPAPILYTSANQTNLIVPYEVAGKASTAMQASYATAGATLQTATWVLPVAPDVPGVFTIDATGTGQAAVVNQDGTVNSASNPAVRGSVVSIYATGEGQTLPAGVTGSVTGSNPPSPVPPVTVTIGGITAAVQYAGSAPDEVAGLLQVNAVVPPGVGPGSAVPVSLSVGGVASQPGVVIAVN
jgi:uncharacterized protein (TIGR03437 family)